MDSDVFLIRGGNSFSSNSSNFSLGSDLEGLFLLFLILYLLLVSMKISIVCTESYFLTTIRIVPFHDKILSVAFIELLILNCLHRDNIL